MNGELLTPREAAGWLKLSESFLEKARIHGGGPNFIRAGRAIRYREEDLHAWVGARVAGSTSEYAATPRPFPDPVIRAAVVSATSEERARSALDPAGWDPQARTITARTGWQRTKLIDRQLRVVFSELGVTISDQVSGEADGRA